MKKQRKIKLFVIIGLLVLMTGMSIGFAVFSDVLTISSSATVTPNKEDFKVTIYGMNESVTCDGAESIDDLISMGCLSKTFSEAPNELSTDAVIDNDKFTISNINVGLTEPNTEDGYLFLIVNEGAYDVYVSLKENGVDIMGVYGLMGHGGTCIPGVGATPALVESACELINTVFMLQDSSGSLIDVFSDGSYYKIPQGDIIFLGFSVEYNYGDARADGPFTVQFPNIEFDFSTAPPSGN